MGQAVIDFVNGLMPRQEKVKILESIANLQTEISEITLPAYERAVDFDKKFPYKSDLYKEFSTRAKTLTNNRASGNVVKDIHKALLNHQQNLVVLNDIIQKDRAKDITVESITYRKANILALISSIEGFVRYASRLCGLLWLCEIGDIQARSIEQVRLPEYIWLKKHQSEFFSSLDIGIRPTQELQKTVNLIPELLVDAETDSQVVASLGKQELIVSRFTVTYSPILYIRLLIEDFNEWRIKRCRDEKEWLESCYLKALSEKESGVKNPALEKRIQFYNDRLETTDRKLKELETAPE